MKERGGLFGSIGGEVIIANDDDNVGRFDTVLYHPKACRGAQQGMPRKIDNRHESANCHQSQQAEENAATLAVHHGCESGAAVGSS